MESPQDGMTELRFISPLIFRIQVRQTHGQTTFHFSPHVDVLERRTNYLWFQSSYWNPSKTDGQTKFHFPSYWGPRQTIGQTLFNPSYSDQVIRTDVETSIHPSYWNPRKTDTRTYYLSFHPVCWDTSKTYKLRLILPRILKSTQDRRTDKLRNISSLILESM